LQHFVNPKCAGGPHFPHFDRLTMKGARRPPWASRRDGRARRPVDSRRRRRRALRRSKLARLGIRAVARDLRPPQAVRDGHHLADRSRCARGLESCGDRIELGWGVGATSGCGHRSGVADFGQTVSAAAARQNLDSVGYPREAKAVREIEVMSTAPCRAPAAVKTREGEWIVPGVRSDARRAPGQRPPTMRPRRRRIPQPSRTSHGRVRTRSRFRA